MSSVTVLFAAVIFVCSVASILSNSLNAKLGRVEQSLKELEIQPEEESLRESYDNAVRVYNESIARFPGILIAWALGFKNIPIEGTKS